ncbi:MAG: hypothetical protein A2X36_01555 [Elusimicrobia bacterium GWA2_69_24]|nr:MAG: hypothetical protein A2X36_01555 [Elusimicrobia bacterium GWA2_69_24]HBL19152.1 DtxR family transcriptional regulator [Elusimicrobiota bacterium]
MYMGAMCRIKPAEVEEEEEALGVVWHYREVGDHGEAGIRQTLSKGVSPEVFDRLQVKGYLRIEAGKVGFSDEGERLARDVTRRHRLAERLLVDMLDLGADSIDENACRWEHILSPEATTAICTLLGHPRHCPHGTAIPPGECCTKWTQQAESVITSLDKLAPGSSGKVAYLALAEKSVMQKLLSLGLTPGSTVSLQQKAPSIVVQAGETVIALEAELARHISVRKNPD